MIQIGDYNFDGPYTSTVNLQNRSGVYAILCRNNGSYHVTDIGESATVKDRVENHDREGCWTQHCSGSLAVAVYYTPGLTQTGRKLIEQRLRNKYDPPCGKA